MLFHAQLQVHSDLSNHPWIKLFRQITSFGWLGVDLFFVLSGFLITGILIDARPASNFYSAFYLRRAVRIFPLYYAVLLIFFGFTWAATFVYGNSTTSLFRLRAAPYAFLYALNLYMVAMSSWSVVSLPLMHFWSLCVEEHFYLFWPPLVRNFTLPSMQRIAIGLMIVSPALRLLFNHLGNPTAMSVFTACRLDGLACGAIVAILMRSESGRSMMLKSWLPALILSALAFAALNFCPSDLKLEKTIGISFAILSFGSLIAAVTLNKISRLRPGLENPVLRFFGKCSYALYVLHQPVFLLLASRPERSSLDPVSDFLALHALGFALTIGLALLSWKYLESPFLSFKRGRPFQFRTVSYESFAKSSAVVND